MRRNWLNSNMKLIYFEDSFTKSLIIFIAYEIPFRNFGTDIIEYVNKSNDKPLLLQMHLWEGLLIMEPLCGIL